MGIKKSISYNLIYRLVTVVTPLITSPYISRVLGPDNVGVFTYTNAIAYYFFLFAMLGVNSYGSREIAKVRDNKRRVSETFWQIYYIQLFLSLILTIIYVASCVVINHKYFTISLIQALYVLSAATDINWFAFGVGEFKVTSIRSIILKMLSVVFIFLCVKNSDDLWIYTLIIQAGNIISLLIIWPLVVKYTTWIKPNWAKIKKHIKPNLILFLPFIASSLYQYMDKIMLGLISTENEVGYYNYAENILSMPMMLTTAVGTVMLPHISNMIANNEKDKSIHILKVFLEKITWINIGMAFGMAAVSYTFIPWYLGVNYIRTAELLRILSPVIIISGCADVLRTQFLIPNEKDKLYTVSICIGAIFNLVFNMMLIPKYGASGASIATVIAHITVMIIQCIFTRKDISYGYIIKKLIPYIFIGIAMYIVVIEIAMLKIQSTIVEIILELIVGILVYIGSTLVWMVFCKKKKQEEP